MAPGPLLSALSLAAALAAGTGGPAMAAGPIADIVCAPSAEMSVRMKRDHASELVGLGMRSHDQVMELWSSASGDWALVIAYASGNSCIVAMGEEWEALPSGLADPA